MRDQLPHRPVSPQLAQRRARVSASEQPRLRQLKTRKSRRWSRWWSRRWSRYTPGRRRSLAANMITVWVSGSNMVNEIRATRLPDYARRRTNQMPRSNDVTVISRIVTASSQWRVRAGPRAPEQPMTAGDTSCDNRAKPADKQDARARRLRERATVWRQVPADT